MSSDSPEGPAVLKMEQAAIHSSFHLGNVLIEAVNWEVHAGEFWVAGGLPGSGKSELLLTAAGLMPAEQGTVQLFGQDVERARDEDWSMVRQRVGFVFPRGGRLFNRLTVAENLGLPIRYHMNCWPGEDQDRVKRVLALTELEAWADFRPDRIPRNLHQRIGLARALVLLPELLILDNPFAGLDPRQIRWWLDFLDRLVREPGLLEKPRITFIISTDNWGPWRGRARRFGLIHERRWIDLGGAEQLSSGVHPAAQDLLLE